MPNWKKVIVSGSNALLNSVTASTAQFTGIVNAGTDTDKFLVLDSDNNVDFRTGAQVLSDIGAGTGTGDVSSTGTPADNQIAVWTNSSTIEGDSNLTWDGSVLNAGGLLYINGGQVWDETTQGTSRGTLHIDPDGTTNDLGGAITFGSSDNASGISASAGIYTATDGTYGSKMYFATTNNYSVGSKTAMMIDHTGRVGIGTTDPDRKLHLKTDDTSTNSLLRIEQSGSGDAAMEFLLTSANLFKIGMDNSNNDAFTFSRGNFGTGLDVMTMRGYDVGIGTTTPSAKLHVTGSGEVIRLQGATGQSYMTFFQGTGGRVGYLGTAGANDIILESADDLNLYSGGSSTMFLDTNNNVGIGTSSPDEKLNVSGSVRVDDGELYVTRDGSARKSVRLHQTTDKGAITLQRDGVDKVNISSDQSAQGHTYFNGTNVNVGIGTDNPQVDLHISSSGELIRIGDDSSGADAYMSLNNRGFLGFDASGGMLWQATTTRPFNIAHANTWGTSLTSRLYINTSGNVGIGTTTPSSKLTVEGTVSASNLALDSIVNAGTDTDKFLVLDSSGNVDFRTGAEVLSDIGAGTGTGDITRVNITAGNGLSGTSVDTTSGDHTQTLTVGAGTGIQVNSGDVAIDYTGTDNFIDSATNLEGTGIATGDTIVYHDATDNNVKKGFVSDLPFTNNTGALADLDTVGTTEIDDEAVTNAKLAHMAANTVKVRNANSTGDPSDFALANTEILIGDGSGFQAASLSGDVTMTNTGVVTLKATGSSGVLGSTANGTKIDTITVDPYGRVLAVATGPTGTGDITGVTLTADSGTASDTTGNVDITIAGTNGIATSATGTTLTVSGSNATTTAKGVVELATTAETTTGTDATRAVTPDGLKDGYQGSTNVDTLGTITTGTWQGSVISTTYLQNTSGTNTGDEPDASTTVKGIVELATTAEVTTGTDTTRAVTPDALNDGYQGTANIDTLGTITSGDVSAILPTGLVSGSSQIDHDQTTNFSADEHFTQANITTVGTVTSGDVSAILPAGTVSGSSQIPDASTTVKGIVELATTAETTTGTDATRAVTPDGLKDGFQGSANIDTLGTITTGTWQGSVISTTYLQNTSGTNTGDEPDASTTVKGIVELATTAEVTTGTDTARAVTPDALNDGYQGTANIDTLGTVTSGDVSAILPTGLVSGSSQIDHDQTTNFSADEHFTQANITTVGTVTSGNVDAILPSNIISSSAQVDHDATTNFNANEHFTQANITTVGTVTSGDVSAILPAGTVSGSSQIPDPTLQEVVDQGATTTTDITFTDSTLAQFGTGNDLRIYHNGTNSLVDNITGDLFITNGANDKDVVIQTDNGAGGTTDYLRADGSLVRLVVDVPLTGSQIRGDFITAGTSPNEYTFPSADGSSGQALTTDGAGNLSFSTISTGGTTINNDANNRVTTGLGTGDLNAEANLTFDGNTLIISESGDAFSYGAIIHDNNTSTQTTGLRIQQQGTGDALLNFHLSSNNQNWTMGVDNSATDRFKIDAGASLGTNPSFAIDTADRVSIATGTAIGTHKLTVAGTVTASAYYGDGSNLAGIGDVSSTGTPANNQLAVWTNSSTVEGDSDLTWDGLNLNVNGTGSFDNLTVNRFGQTNLTIKASTAGGAELRLVPSTGGTGLIQTIGAFDLELGANSTKYLTVKSSTGHISASSAITGSDVYINSYGSISDAFDDRKLVEDVANSTTLLLNNTSGRYYTTSANSATTYTTSSAVTGGFAYVKINAASEPTVTGCKKISGSAFVTSADMTMVVYEDGDGGRFYFLDR